MRWTELGSPAGRGGGGVCPAAGALSGEVLVTGSVVVAEGIGAVEASVTAMGSVDGSTVRVNDQTTSAPTSRAPATMIVIVAREEVGSGD